MRACFHTHPLHLTKHSNSPCCARTNRFLTSVIAIVIRPAVPAFLVCVANLAKPIEKRLAFVWTCHLPGYALQSSNIGRHPGAGRQRSVNRRRVRRTRWLGDDAGKAVDQWILQRGVVPKPTLSASRQAKYICSAGDFMHNSSFFTCLHCSWLGDGPFNNWHASQSSTLPRYSIVLPINLR